MTGALLLRNAPVVASDVTPPPPSTTQSSGSGWRCPLQTMQTLFDVLHVCLGACYGSIRILNIRDGLVRRSIFVEKIRYLCEIGRTMWGFA